MSQISPNIFSIFYQIWWGPNGYVDRMNRQKKVSSLIEKEDNLLSQRRALTSRIEKIKYWDEAIESAARETLSMVKSDEQFFEFKRKNDQG